MSQDTFASVTILEYICLISYVKGAQLEITEARTHPSRSRCVDTFLEQQFNHEYIGDYIYGASSFTTKSSDIGQHLSLIYQTSTCMFNIYVQLYI